MSREILVARPNAFILKNMKQLLHDCEKQPIVLQQFEELDDLKNAKFSGIVISTAVSSSLNASFESVLESVLKNFKGVPILLATLLDSEKAKRSLQLLLKKLESDHELVSVSEVIKNEVSPRDKLLIIEKKNISDANSYNQVVDVVNKFFNQLN